jgi:hypothetical protein
LSVFIHDSGCWILDLKRIEGGERGYICLFQIHGFHSLIHPFHYIHHTTSNLPHRNSSLYPTSHRINPTSQSQQIQSFILLADRVLRINLRNVVVTLLYCLYLLSTSAINKEGEGMVGEAMYTFFNLSFSVFSSLLAFAACRFSCLAVNWRHTVSALLPNH